MLAAGCGNPAGGWALDEVEFSAEYATASKDVDLGFMTIPKDTHGAIRCGWHGRVAGRTVVHMQAIWFLTTELNEGWERPDEHYHVVVKGEPTVDTHIQFIPPESWGNHEWDTMTAMPAVNACFDIVAAAPGYLRPQGWLLLEHGYDQGNAVRRLLSGAGFDAVETRRDLAGQERISGGHRGAD